MSADIDALTEKLRAFAKAREWSQFHSPKNLACALSVESGELLENFQWLTEKQSRHLSEDQKQAVARALHDMSSEIVPLRRYFLHERASYCRKRLCDFEYLKT